MCSHQGRFGLLGALRHRRGRAEDHGSRAANAVRVDVENHSDVGDRPVERFQLALPPVSRADAWPRRWKDDRREDLAASKAFSRRTSFAGGTKNASTAMTRRGPRGSPSSTFAPSAINAVAAVDGCTIAHPSCPKIAWYWFSPRKGETRCAAFARAVKMLRAEVPATRSLQQIAANRRDLAQLRARRVARRVRESTVTPPHRGWSASCASVTFAPMRSVPSGCSTTCPSSGIIRRLTIRAGASNHPS